MVKFVVERFFAASGSPERPVYKLVPVNGVLELQEAGKENFQDYIESFKDSCDIGRIIQRVNNGEIDLLNAQQGFYGDVSQLPSELREIYDVGLAAQRSFNSLSDEQKKNFDGFEDFAGSAGSVEWLRKLGIDISEPNTTESEVSE